jgi:hypothetical protein
MKVVFNTEALEALKREFERDHPWEVFTASACAGLIIEKLNEEEKKKKKKPAKK